MDLTKVESSMLVHYLVISSVNSSNGLIKPAQVTLPPETYNPEHLVHMEVEEEVGELVLEARESVVTVEKRDTLRRLVLS